MVFFLVQCDRIKELTQDYFHIFLCLLDKNEFGLVSFISFPLWILRKILNCQIEFWGL